MNITFPTVWLSVFCTHWT